MFQLVEFVEVSTTEHIRALAELAAEIWTDYFTPIIGEAQVQYMLEKFQSEKAITKQIAEGHQYFVEQIEEGLVGYLACVPEIEIGRMQLSKLYVEPEDRGKGFGRDAMKFAEQHCRIMGASRLWLTVNKNNTAAIGFYEHMGFTNTGPLVQQIGSGFVMDDYRMEKRIDMHDD